MKRSERERKVRRQFFPTRFPSGPLFSFMFIVFPFFIFLMYKCFFSSKLWRRIIM